MDFGVQVLIALGITCAIGIPVTLYKYNKYRKEGKSVKYLSLKVAIAVVIPIMTILVLLNEELTLLDKLIMIILGFISMVAYAYAVTSARRTFRKIMGLPPEDEHTGEVIKDNKKKK